MFTPGAAGNTVSVLIFTDSSKRLYRCKTEGNCVGAMVKRSVKDLERCIFDKCELLMS